jgi:predicted phage tail component-like protein
MYEIIFNGKGSLTDFGALLIDFSPQPPAPKKIKDSVPFMNGSYDFSTVATNGEVVFNERKINCSLDFFADSKAEMYVQYSSVLEWLLSGKHELIYTGEPNMQYLASVDEAPSFDEFVRNNGTLSFNFTADPFKQSVALEGENEWDAFNFLTDSLQNVEFDINGYQAIQIYNTGRPTIPTINCSKVMLATISGYTATFKAGDNQDWRFKLQRGLNNIGINGAGKIKFIFRKEVL